MMYKRILFLLISIMVLFAGKASAGVFTYTSKLQGSALVNNTVLETIDDQYLGMTNTSAGASWHNLNKNRTVDNFIHLKYTGAANMHYIADWSVQVTCKVERWDEFGVLQPAETCVLKIDYKPAAGSKYTDISTFKSFFAGGHRVRVTVLGIAFSGLTAMPADVLLENVISVERSHKMDPAAPIGISYNGGCAGTSNTDNIEFSWTYLLGAEEYDFEWVFKSDYEQPPQPVDFADATRITTSNQYYSISTTFDKGKIYYRVRGVSKDFGTGTQRLEGNWFSVFSPIQVCNVEKRNWTYNAVYAEEGKRKEVMTYFDGSGRTRQSVTLSNTEGAELVAENMYDYEGRPAIQTLPAPSKSFRGNLKFYEAFNLNSSGSPYSKRDFDLDILSPCQSAALTPGMNSSAGQGNGASLYYSENNPLVNAGPLLVIPDNGFNVLIPDADDYPFTQTVYGNDGSVKAQSGVGPAHAIKSGHETQYFNTTASQEKLDRLFGNEVGYDEHYREKVVIDPNGQISVSFEDLSGRVIATCLRGKTPSNLEALDMPEEPYTANSPAEKVFEHFSNAFDPASESYISQENFLVDNYTVPYKFSYIITPQDFKSLCTSTTYGCDYLLRFSLADDCNTEMLDPANGHVSAIKSNHPVISISDLSKAIPLHSINFAGAPFKLSFTIQFPKNGVYRLEKNLSLDPGKVAEAVSKFEADLRAHPSPCIPDLVSFQNAFDLVKDDEGCETCEEACAKFITEWKAQHNGVWVTYTDLDGLIFTDENEYLFYCENECRPEIPKRNCDGLLEALKEDMSPGGQYFEKTVGVSPNFYNYINLIAHLQDSNPFIDEFFQDFKYYVAANNCTSLASNANANWHAYLTTHWDPCYADFLVLYHPEYCRYLRCTELSSSYDYDALLLNTKYAVAVSSPNNYISMPNGTHNSLVNSDPYFQIPSNSLQKQQMINEINSCTVCATYFPTPLYTPPANKSMWNWAAIAPNPISTGASANDEQWANFAKIYTSVKNKDFVHLYPGGGAYSALNDTPSPDNVSDHYANYNPNTLLGKASVFTSCISNPTPVPHSIISMYANGMTINDPDPTSTFVSAFSSTIGSTTNPASILPDLDVCLYSSSTIQVNLGTVAPGSSSANPKSTKCNPTVCQPFTTPANALPANANEQTLIFYVQIGKVPINYPMNVNQDLTWSGGNCYVRISDPVLVPILSGNSSIADKNYYLNQIKLAINNYVGSPYDFTCTVVYPSAATPSIFSYKIVAPASLGPFGNPTDLKLSISKTTKSGSSYATQYECRNSFTTAARDLCDQYSLEVDNCLCVLIGQADEYYAVHPPAAGTIDQNIANSINSSLGFTGPDVVSELAIASWRSLCDQKLLTSSISPDADTQAVLRTQQILYPIPDKLKCEEPCENEQADDEADFYAEEEFEALIEAKVEEFINAYKQTCLHQTNLAEAFMVEYELLEYHYTLYYYDQAGNLVRTIPPSGVKRITASNLYDANHHDKVHLARITPNSTKIYPEHSRYASGIHSIHNANFLVTNYKYNTLNQLVEQETPDGGLSKFWYNDIGQLRFSQNAKQKAKALTAFEAYSYTNYDGQGRIIEVGENGEVSVVVTNGIPSYSFAVNVNNPLFPSLEGTEVTKTYYDQPLPSLPFIQNFLRKRVSSVTYEDVEDASDLTFNSASHYNYDVHGNVDMLVQDYPDLKVNGNQYKKIYYTFDLISGNVNEVQYQPHQFDEYYHKYEYDANNRITHVYTSNDNIHWQQDARYFYYLHGPLARVEIGEDKVQGLDYAYNLQGWVKAVNSNTLSDNYDPGKDGYTGEYFTGQNDIHKNIARDVFGYSLEYYRGDYKSIATNPLTTRNWATDLTGSISLPGTTPYSATPDLFNGNIKAMATAMYQPAANAGALPFEMETIARFFKYDQLNRIKEAQSYLFPSSATVLNGVSPYTTPGGSAYFESFKYDANGNILNAFRNGPAGLGMDDMTYHYDDLTKNNQLAWVEDKVPDGHFTEDIDDQTSHSNYEYDAIGNLTSDEAEGIVNIDWSVYGKILKIYKGGIAPNIVFQYDPSGNRIQKTVIPKTRFGEKTQEDWITTYYVRDAQGNVMAIYDRKLALKANVVLDSFLLKETPVYGSSRLGLEEQEDRTGLIPFHAYGFGGYHTDGTIIPGAAATPPVPLPRTLFDHVLGNKRYELSNHLGNVNAVISDRKLSVAGGGGAHDYYLADVVSSTDYYAFGAPMVGRTFSAATYRYGFNGKENDDEVKGIEGSQQDYGMRIYDPRIGKFLSVDPLAPDYPWNSTYSFAENDVIRCTDLDGAEKKINIYAFNDQTKGYTLLKTMNWGQMHYQRSGPFGYGDYNMYYTSKGEFVGSFYAAASPLRFIVEGGKDVEDWSIFKPGAENGPGPLGGTKGFHNEGKQLIGQTLLTIATMGIGTAISGLNASWKIYAAANFSYETGSKLITAGGDITKVDWFDVILSTTTKTLTRNQSQFIKDMGDQFKNAASATFDANVDGGFRAVFFNNKYNKDGGSVAVDITASQFKDMLGNYAKAFGGDAPSEQAVKLLMDHLKAQFKDKVNKINLKGE